VTHWDFGGNIPWRHCSVCHCLHSFIVLEHNNINNLRVQYWTRCWIVFILKSVHTLNYIIAIRQYCTNRDVSGTSCIDDALCFRLTSFVALKFAFGVRLNVIDNIDNEVQTMALWDRSPWCVSVHTRLVDRQTDRYGIQPLVSGYSICSCTT